MRFDFLCKFPILRRIERNIIINAYRGLHVKYQFFLPVLNQTYIFPTFFRKILKCQSVSCGWTYGQPRRRVAFHNFAKSAYKTVYTQVRLTAVSQCSMCNATNRKVAGSIPAGVSGFFIDIKSFRSHYGPGGSSQPLT